MDCIPTTSITPTSTKPCPPTPASQTGPVIIPRQSSRCISKYLVQIAPSVTPNRPKKSAKRIMGVHKCRVGCPSSSVTREEEERMQKREWKKNESSSSQEEG